MKKPLNLCLNLIILFLTNDLIFLLKWFPLESHWINYEAGSFCSTKSVLAALNAVGDTNILKGLQPKSYWKYFVKIKTWLN